MDLALREALEARHEFICTEHILLGLLGEGSGVGAKVLSGLGADVETARREVKRLVKPVPAPPPPGEPKLSPQARLAVETAVSVADALGHSGADTEHLLLGLLRARDGVAVQVLTRLCCPPERTRRAMLEAMGSGDDPGDETEPPVRLNARKLVATPVLDEYGVDLTALAREGGTDPIIGRDAEIERVIQVLCGRIVRSPLLVGPAGVGRRSIVRGLARRIVWCGVPPTLLDARVVALDLTAMVAGTKNRGVWEERLRAVVSEAERSGNVVSFIDDLGVLINAGDGEGSISAAHALAPGFARGMPRCIAVATPEEYERYRRRLPALVGRFRVIPVRPMQVDQTATVLAGYRDRLNRHHGVQITDSALTAAVNLSAQFLPSRPQPQAAIEVIDEAASRACLSRFSSAPNLAQIELELKGLRFRRDNAVSEGQREQADELGAKIEALCARVEQRMRALCDEGCGVVDGEMVAGVIREIARGESSSVAPRRNDREDRVPRATLTGGERQTMLTNMNLWQRAASFAARAHRGMYRRDGQTPYVAHPFRVALTISQVFGFHDEPTLAAALLHDVMEDTDVDYDELAASFGTEVANLAAALSKDRRLPEADREAAYDEQLRHADWRARLVKLADQYDNLLDAREDGSVGSAATDRCRRALELACDDDHRASVRARKALEQLLDDAEGNAAA